jgi:uncharacterized membrane protein YobD (UPF0266 family)
MMNYILKRWQDSSIQYILTHSYLLTRLFVCTVNITRTGHDMFTHSYLLTRLFVCTLNITMTGHGMLTHSYLLARLVLLVVKIAMIRRVILVIY